MTNNHKHITVVYQTVIIQLIMGLFAVLAFAAHKHTTNILLSSLVGLALAIIPTLVYTKVAFGSSLIATPNIAYLRHKKAMVSRFILNLLLFSVVILVYKHCDYIALLITYIAALSGYWVSLLIIK